MTKRLQAILTQMQARLEQAVYAALNAGKEQGEIDTIVKTILDESNFSNMFAADLNAVATAAVEASIAKAETKYKWILTRTQQTNVERSVNILTKQTASHIVRAEQAIKEKVSRKIAEGVISGTSRADLIESIVRETGSYRTVVRTWENTSRAGYQNGASIAVAKEAGVEKFKLVGAAPERSWCKVYYEQSKPLAFWKRQNNGQGLPVVPYCGGYNCVHTLEPDIA